MPSSTTQILLSLAQESAKLVKGKNPFAIAMAWVKEGLAYFAQLADQQYKLAVREFLKPADIRRKEADTPAWQPPSEPPTFKS